MMRDTGPLGKESGPSRASVESRDLLARIRASRTPARRRAGSATRPLRLRTGAQGRAGGSDAVTVDASESARKATAQVLRTRRHSRLSQPPRVRARHAPSGGRLGEILPLNLRRALTVLRSIHSVCNTGPPSARRDGLFLLAVLGAILLGTRRGRKTGVLVLAFTLGFASVEVAVHSVHHMGDPEGAPSCQVHSASQHVAGAIANPSQLCAPTPVPAAPVALRRDQILPARFSHPDEGRAPPATPSAA